MEIFLHFIKISLDSYTIILMSILTHTKKTIKLKKQQTCMNKMKPSIKETGGGDSLSFNMIIRSL